MCNCVEEFNKKFSEHLGVEGRLENVEMLSGKVYSTFSYRDSKDKEKTESILHSHCPFCGKSYKEENDNE